MQPYTVFPEKPIIDNGPMARTFLSMGINDFHHACRYVHELPYGYNSDRGDPMILFKENMGSCTTKHAVIATLAAELGTAIDKHIGIYAMTEALVTGTKPILDRYNLPYLPMVHCFLVFEEHRIDLSEGNRNGKNDPIDDFLYTEKVMSNISGKDEYLLYRKALNAHILPRSEFDGIAIKTILKAREEGLTLLRANIQKIRGSTMKNENADTLRQMVRSRYTMAVTGTGCGCTTHAAGGCCGSNSDSLEQVNRTIGYSDMELGSVIDGANLGLGCGNPTAIGELHPGDIVLDLGSGAGFDCFLAAQKVGEKGRVIGVDMTPEMLSKARENAVKMNVANVEFRLGEIEHLPVADNSVDIIISNCVINLSPEKQQVFKDACRVLKPGGRLFVSDVVATAEMPDSMREQAALITGCIAGAERTDRLRYFLDEAGFENIKIELKAHSEALVSGWFPGSGVEKYVSSADIYAVKPK